MAMYQQPQLISPFQQVRFPSHASRPSFTSGPLPAFPQTGIIQVNQGGPLIAQRLPQVVILGRSTSVPGLAQGPSFNLPAGPSRQSNGAQVRGHSAPAAARIGGPPPPGVSTPGTPGQQLMRCESVPYAPVQQQSPQQLPRGISAPAAPPYAVQTPQFTGQQSAPVRPQVPHQQLAPRPDGSYPVQQLVRPDGSYPVGSAPAYGTPSAPGPEPSMFGLGETLAGMGEAITQSVAVASEALTQSVAALVARDDAPSAPPAAPDPFSQQQLHKESQVDMILLRGQYRVVRQQFRPDKALGVIGQGAFGVVYRAVKDGGSLDVAVKMIESRCPQHKELIAKEIEVLQMVNHPSIVNLKEVIVEHALDWMFIVMEFVEGGDLLERATQDPVAFDESLVRVLMFHMTCGLAYAHGQGIMHRDIKPENILMCKDGFPKVADFGLARTMGPVVTQPWKTQAGSPAYSAPEVSHKESIYDYSADVFSLGLVFADLLHPKVLCGWIFEVMAPEDKNRFSKRWPPGVGPLKEMSGMIQGIQQKMIQQVPGHRPSLHQVCQDLLGLAKENPMPHPFWGRETVMPEGPPQQRAVSAEQAANIAGMSGYALGSPVQVQAGSGWCPGIVEHINTTVCPGAVNVRFTNSQGAESCVMVMPWHFAACLRPNPKGVAPPAGAGARTRGAQPNGQERAKGAPHDAAKKCSKCCVVM